MYFIYYQITTIKLLPGNFNWGTMYDKTIIYCKYYNKPRLKTLSRTNKIRIQIKHENLQLCSYKLKMKDLTQLQWPCQTWTATDLSQWYCKSCHFNGHWAISLWPKLRILLLVEMASKAQYSIYSVHLMCTILQVLKQWPSGT